MGAFELQVARRVKGRSAEGEDTAVRPHLPVATCSGVYSDPYDWRVQWPAAHRAVVRGVAERKLASGDGEKVHGRFLATVASRERLGIRTPIACPVSSPRRRVAAPV
jgi:hypothetical protein